MLEIYRFDSGFPGKKVLFLGSVHGNEVCGSVALDRFRNEVDSGTLSIAIGEVVAIPRCNRKAYEESKRFIDCNLNRVITPLETPSLYEEFIAQELLKEILKVDYVVDLHSMTADTVPMVFVDYENKENEKLARASGISHCVYGWSSLFLSGEPSADTISYANECGKFGITIECGQHASPLAIECAYTSICTILQSLSILQAPHIGTQSEFHFQKFRMKKVFFRENDSDVMVKKYRNFDFVEKYSTVAVRSNGEHIQAPSDGYIMLPNDRAMVGHEWFYFGMLCS